MSMRATSGREAREYITKRICISFVFSIGFFTLIAGFLLGKFTTDRQYYIKRLREADVSAVKELEHTLEDLYGTARNITVYQSTLLQPNSNARLWETYIKCGCLLQKNADFDEKVSNFVENLINAHIKSFTDCLKILDELLHTIDD
ncbi:uncharacterized protein LOC129790673 [Lutzomyia longipalpis]|uniref:Uncharacterized protein n=2 Tax=Lutzomyia longipalpis TaxID=7200 RepID=A0A1B0CBR6_LUTLO|nr:uncharacterized protein LOC129790673 [Lutzomyia longipalpis]XP_055684307.1 uncharacterized protein LOC129790673 [Lutzomyia longipalpis]XP_055684316.1 uncharacterized protein LOC129790673 [Lutzomyia longipalpis]